MGKIRLHEAQHRWALAHIIDAEHHIICAKHNLVLCPLKRNDVSLRLNDVDRKRSNDVVSEKEPGEKPDFLNIYKEYTYLLRKQIICF